MTALLCPQDLKPKNSRSPRSGTWEPPGYVSAKDRQGKYVFNRSHILGDRFNGKWIKENIFTGFKQMNDPGMKRCENRMADALASGDTLLYSGQLLYGNGRENLPTGIHMTAIAKEKVLFSGKFVENRPGPQVTC